MSQTQRLERNFGDSPKINQDVNGYGSLQARGAANFAEPIADLAGGLTFDNLAQIFNDIDSTGLQAFGASTAYGLHKSPDGSVRTSTAKGLSDTDGALAFNEAVNNSLPSNPLVALIGAMILKKIANRNAEIAKEATPGGDATEEEPTKEKIAGFVAMKLAMHQASASESSG